MSNVTIPNSYSVSSNSTLGGTVDFTLAGSGSVSGATSLNVANPTATITLSGLVTGLGGVRKQSGGKLVLAANNTYSGATIADGGLLVINGIQGNNPVTVNAQGSLGGSGTVGSVTVKGGRFSPGQSPGIFTVNGNISFDVASILTSDIDAFIPGTGFDQVRVVNGQIILGGQLIVTLRAGFNPDIGSQFPIIQNNSGLAVQGTFTNLAEQAGLVVNGLTFQISYQGGTSGRDVVLTRGIKTTTTMTSSANPLPPGGQLVLTVTVTGVLTSVGNVRLEDGATVVGAPTAINSAGQVSFAPTLGPGTHALKAVFEQNGNFFGSASTVLSQSIQELSSQNGTIQLSSGSFLVNESAGNFTATAMRTGGTVGQLAVQFTTGDATAKAGIHYTRTSGTLTFNDGETAKNIVVPLARDLAVQGDLSFTLGLFGVAVGSPAGASIVIRDDELPRVLDSAPDLARLKAAGEGFGKSLEHYQDFVSKAYRQFLGREADPQGLAFWVGQMQLYETSLHALGMRQQEIEAGFLASPEYLGRFGGVGEAWIRGIYNDLLGRTADAAGLNFWLAQLSGGATPQNVALGFTASDERLTNRVEEAYRTFLGRGSDAAGLAFWKAVFNAGGTTEDINSGFVGSPEYYNNPNKGAGNKAKWVGRAYEDVLFRKASTAEVNLWLRFIDTGSFG